MTLKTDANGTLLRTHPGITTTDIQHGPEFLNGFDKTFGKRCIKHRQETEPCTICKADEESGFIKHRVKSAL